MKKKRTPIFIRIKSPKLFIVGLLALIAFTLGAIKFEIEVAKWQERKAALAQESNITQPVTEPKAKEPEVVEPEVVEPKVTTEPEVVEPEVVAEPEIKEPEVVAEPVEEPEFKDVIIFENPKKGNVTFPHLDHSDAFECATCHHKDFDTEGPKSCRECHVPFQAFHNKTKTQSCRACHEENGAGPGFTPCANCHQKKK